MIITIEFSDKDPNELVFVDIDFYAIDTIQKIDLCLDNYYFKKKGEKHERLIFEHTEDVIKFLRDLRCYFDLLLR